LPTQGNYYNYGWPGNVQTESCHLKRSFVNEVLDKGGVKDLVAEVYELCGQDVTTEVADHIKDIGFEFAMRSGSTIAVADITVPPEKVAILANKLRRS